MSWRFIENDLCFEFDDRLWSPILPWDRDPAYTSGIKRLDNSKAIDVVGIFDGKKLFFIEVKDYRRWGHEDPQRLRIQFEQKVRSTVAGIVGANRCEQPDLEHQRKCNALAKALVEPMELRLVVWMERPSFSRMPPEVADKRHRVGASSKSKLLNERVHWLHARVATFSMHDEYQRTLPGLTVRSLPYARKTMVDRILEVLTKRSLKPSTDENRQICDCLDLDLLDHWLEQTHVVASVADLLRSRR